MASSIETKIVAMYINAHGYVPQRVALIEMGHPEPMTLMLTKNLASQSVVRNNIQPRMKKDLDMCFHWLRCQYAQGHFRYYW